MREQPADLVFRQLRQDFNLYDQPLIVQQVQIDRGAALHGERLQHRQQPGSRIIEPEPFEFLTERVAHVTTGGGRQRHIGDRECLTH